MLSALLSKLPASMVADWRFGRMSVCIAVLCNDKKTLICVSDNKVNFGTFSADTIAMKDIPIYKKCTALVAGNDMEHATPILQRAVQIIYADSTPKSPEDVANSVDQAFARGCIARLKGRFFASVALRCRVSSIKVNKNARPRRI